MVLAEGPLQVQRPRVPYCHPGARIFGTKIWLMKLADEGRNGTARTMVLLNAVELCNRGEVEMNPVRKPPPESMRSERTTR